MGRSGEFTWLDLGGGCGKSGFQVRWLEVEQRGPMSCCLAVVLVRGVWTKHDMGSRLDPGEHGKKSEYHVGSVSISDTFKE